jgi:Domain of unknown function (DUF4189)
MSPTFQRLFAPPIGLALFSMLCLPLPSYSHSSVAYVPGMPLRTIYAAWNYPTQQQADAFALKGCRAEARMNQVPKKKAACTVFHRQSVPGAGAVVCGTKGCSVSTGFGSKDDAMISAYRQCEQHGYQDCQRTEITNWIDIAGYKHADSDTRGSTKACSPPPGKSVHSTYRCQNGDCVRTFANGCSFRFQAAHCFNPMKSTWEWKPDGC